MDTTTDPVFAAVRAGLDRTTAEILRLGAVRPDEPADTAARAHRMADLYERTARWWRVLARSEAMRTRVDLLFYRAVLGAQGDAEHEARFWRDNARAWDARTEEAR
ncbi:hypothetical protein [Pseudonocardia alni]|uniref:hypothetical protein n=1 Tax=Pseudonocardia alni TaxID=33907 RepID=UPI002798D881|nr:hypothetical protein PaSha_17730 [Pseudonocardia alni]